MSKNKGIVLWDIDGTLLSTQRPSDINLHQKILEECGFGTIHASFETQGVTDWEIISRLINSTQYDVNQTQTAHILKELDLLSEKIDNQSTFQVLPGVVNFLESFNSDSWGFGILTGNTLMRTLAKLTQTSLTNFFLHDYIFACENGEKRIDIAQRARGYLLTQGIRNIILIGDTPHDITVAREIGAWVISVATGKYSQDELQLFQPDLLIKNLRTSSQEIINFLYTTENLSQ